MVIDEGSASAWTWKGADMNVDAGGGIAARVERIGARIAERELDALLVEDAADLRYVSGYTGSNGLALLRVGHQFVALGAREG